MHCNIFIHRKTLLMVLKSNIINISQEKKWRSMDDPSIRSYLNKLSEQLEGDEALLNCIPKGIFTCSDKKVVHFLENDAFLLLKRSICFRPKNNMTAFAKAYGVDIRLLECVRRIKESPYAISFHIMTSVSQSDGALYPKKSCEISICVFNLLNTIGEIENYKSLENSLRLDSCKEVFRTRCEKNLYGPLLQSVINFLPHRRAWHDKQKIFNHLERLTVGIAWLADQKISTFLSE